MQTPQQVPREPRDGDYIAYIEALEKGRAGPGAPSHVIFRKPDGQLAVETRSPSKFRLPALAFPGKKGDAAKADPGALSSAAGGLCTAVGLALFVGSMAGILNDPGAPPAGLILIFLGTVLLSRSQQKRRSGKRSGPSKDKH